MPLLKYKKRKSLIRALNEFESEKVIRKRERSQSYNDIHLAILKQVWTGMNYACGQRIAAALPEWLKNHKTCSDHIRDRLVNMGGCYYRSRTKASQDTSKRTLLLIVTITFGALLAGQFQNQIT